VGTFYLVRPRRLARPRTPPFHGDNMGSNPIGDTKHSKGLNLNNSVTRRVTCDTIVAACHSPFPMLVCIV
jgi:hypothetical protein